MGREGYSAGEQQHWKQRSEGAQGCQECWGLAEQSPNIGREAQRLWEDVGSLHETAGEDRLGWGGVSVAGILKRAV